MLTYVQAAIVVTLLLEVLVSSNKATGKLILLSPATEPADGTTNARRLLYSVRCLYRIMEQSENCLTAYFFCFQIFLFVSCLVLASGGRIRSSQSSTTRTLGV